MKIYMVKHVYNLGGKEVYLRSYYNNVKAAARDKEKYALGDISGAIHLMKWDKEGELVSSQCIETW